MPAFSTTRRVRHSATDMFNLVADVERYPEFVPLCRSLKVRSRTSGPNGTEVVVADIAIALLAVDQPAVAVGGGEMHKPDRLFRAAAARAGHPGDRDCKMGERALDGAARHRLGGLPAHRAVLAEHCGRNSQHRL